MAPPDHDEPSNQPNRLPPCEERREEEQSCAMVGFGLGWTAVATLAFAEQLKVAAAIASVLAIRNGLMEVFREEPYTRLSAPKNLWELKARGSKVRARVWAMGAAVYALAALFGSDRAGAVAVAVLFFSIGSACLTLGFDVRRSPRGIPTDRLIGDPVGLWLTGVLLILLAANALAWA